MSEKGENNQAETIVPESGRDKNTGRFVPGNEEGKKKAGKKHKNTAMIEKIENIKAAGLIKGLGDLKAQTIATAAYFLMHGTKKERIDAYKELLPFMEPKLKSTEIKSGGKEKVIRVYLPEDSILNKEKEKEGKNEEKNKEG